MISAPPPPDMHYSMDFLDTTSRYRNKLVLLSSLLNDNVLRGVLPTSMGLLVRRINGRMLIIY